MRPRYMPSTSLACEIWKYRTTSFVICPCSNIQLLPFTNIWDLLWRMTIWLTLFFLMVQLPSAGAVKSSPIWDQFKQPPCYKTRRSSLLQDTKYTQTWWQPPRPKSGWEFQGCTDWPSHLTASPPPISPPPQSVRTASIIHCLLNILTWRPTLKEFPD